MIRSKFIFILALVVYVTGNGNMRGINYYGTSNIRVQNPSQSQAHFSPPSKTVQSQATAPSQKSLNIAPQPLGIPPRYAPVPAPSQSSTNVAFQSPVNVAYETPVKISSQPATFPYQSPVFVAQEPSPPVNSQSPKDNNRPNILTRAPQRPARITPRLPPVSAPQPPAVDALQQSLVPDFQQPSNPDHFIALYPQPNYTRYTQRPPVYTSYVTQNTKQHVTKRNPPISQTHATPVFTRTRAPPVDSQTRNDPRQKGLVKFNCKNGNGFYGVDNECDSYIECKQSKAMKYICPEGLYFNSEARHYEYPCAPSSLVECTEEQENQNARPTHQCPKQRGYFSMRNGDCNKYMICQGGVATIMNCPADLVFNREISTCDWQENVPQCNPDAFTDFKCPEAELDENGFVTDNIIKYRFNDECKLYVACHRGYPRLLSCYEDLVFDESAQKCVDSDYVEGCSVSLSKE